VKYGVTRNFVLGLEAVLPSGDIITTGGKFVKCSTGYDLTRLLVGSEGTLAVVTKTLVRLMLAPGKREVLLVPFKTLEAAIGTVPAILRAGIIPAGIEFLQRDIVVLVEKYTGREFPLRDNEAFLMILVESADERSLMEELNLIGETCRRSGAVDVYIPPSERARRHLLEMREKFYPTVRTLPNVQIADVVVPRSRIAEFVTGVKETAARLGVAVLAYGHAGDGNVHIHPYSPVSDGAAGKRNQARLFDEIYRLGAAMGGAASGEHGLGYDKKKYLVVSYSPETVAMMKRIKQAFDPLGILNPGKVFP